MNLKKDFGVRLKELRTKSGITQSELAERVGVDAKHISHIETGRSFPKADLLERISKELDVSITDIFAISHLQPKETLIKEVVGLLKKASQSDVAKVYKVVNSCLK